jgi:hypothetical protein
MVAIVVASGHLSLLHGISVGWQAMRQAGLAANIEFKNSRHHNDRLRSISILKHCEAERLGAVNEKSATSAALVLDDPISPAVFADQKERNPRTRFRGGRLDMFHDTSPSSWMVAFARPFSGET